MEKPSLGGIFVVPFSFLYVIGLLLGLIVLLTKVSPFGLSLGAGICMFLGVIGGMAGAGLMELTGELAEATVEISGGIGFAFVWSIVYIVAWFNPRQADGLSRPIHQHS